MPHPPSTAHAVTLNGIVRKLCIEPSDLCLYQGGFRVCKEGPAAESVAAQTCCEAQHVTSLGAGRRIVCCVQSYHPRSSHTNHEKRRLGNMAVPWQTGLLHVLLLLLAFEIGMCVQVQLQRAHQPWGKNSNYAPWAPTTHQVCLPSTAALNPCSSAGDINLSGLRASGPRDGARDGRCCVWPRS